MTLCRAIDHWQPWRWPVLDGADMEEYGGEDQTPEVGKHHPRTTSDNRGDCAVNEHPGSFMSDALSSPPKMPIVVPNVWWRRKVQRQDENVKEGIKGHSRHCRKQEQGFEQNAIE